MPQKIITPAPAKTSTSAVAANKLTKKKTPVKRHPSDPPPFIKQEISAHDMLVKRAKELANDVMCLVTDIKDDPAEDIHEEIRKILEVPLCMLVKIVVPDARQKLEEIVAASELGFIVSKSQNGTDMTDTVGNCYELKTSVYKKNGKCNFVWTVPSGKDGDQIREKLIRSAKKKTGGGGVICKVTNPKGQQLALYTLGSAFILEYFSRVTLPKNGFGNINFGSQRCEFCGEFHRVLKMQALSNFIDSGEKPQEWQWDELKNTPRNCKKK
jgi:hypothetical protein